MQIKELPEDYALVLQEIGEAGQEDFTSLAESLELEQTRLVHIVWSLRNKGLLRVNYTAQEAWLSLSAKGRKFSRMLWPESHMQASY